MKKEIQQEIAEIGSFFPTEHDRVTVKVEESYDDLTVNFKFPDIPKIRVECNFSEYSHGDCHSKPIWFTESENSKVLKIVSEMENLPFNNPNPMQQSVAHLIQEVSLAMNQHVPVEIFKFDINTREGIVKIMNPDQADICAEKIKVLEKLKKNVSTHSSLASQRLMKEIQALYKSDSFKRQDFNVTTTDDDIYLWNVELLRVNGQSQLAADLKKTVEKKIQLSFKFSPDFPFKPPFIRLVTPVIQCKHIEMGGAICTELLTPKGWRPTYTMEAVIIQIVALLEKGGARICFDSNSKNLYSEQKAKVAYQRIIAPYFSARGWTDKS